jgi:hypothetical protein
VAYIGSLLQHSLGVNGLNIQGCSLPMARLLERQFPVVLTKLRAAQTKFRSGGRAVRQVLTDNFLDGGHEIRRRVLARVEEAIKHAERVLVGAIVIECSTAPDCCGGARPACIIPDRGLDRIFVCIPNLLAQQGGTTRLQQILIHELFHRAGLQGPEMHMLEFTNIDCDKGGYDNKNIRELAKGGVNLLEIVDLHVRAVWCLALG